MGLKVNMEVRNRILQNPKNLDHARRQVGFNGGVSTLVEKLTSEAGSIIITAVGTGLVAPVVIATNPVSKEDKETKVYSAWRQPLSAVITVVTQLSVFNKVKSIMNAKSKEGTINLNYDQSCHLTSEEGLARVIQEDYDEKLQSVYEKAKECTGGEENKPFAQLKLKDQIEVIKTECKKNGIIVDFEKFQSAYEAAKKCTGGEENKPFDQLKPKDQIEVIKTEFKKNGIIIDSEKLQSAYEAAKKCTGGEENKPFDQLKLKDQIEVIKTEFKKNGIIIDFEKLEKRAGKRAERTFGYNAAGDILNIFGRKLGIPLNEVYSPEIKAALNNLDKSHTKLAKDYYNTLLNHSDENVREIARKLSEYNQDVEKEYRNNIFGLIKKKTKALTAVKTDEQLNMILYQIRLLDKIETNWSKAEKRGAKPEDARKGIINNVVEYCRDLEKDYPEEYKKLGITNPKAIAEELFDNASKKAGKIRANVEEDKRRKVKELLQKTAKKDQVITEDMIDARIKIITENAKKESMTILSENVPMQKELIKKLNYIKCYIQDASIRQKITELTEEVEGGSKPKSASLIDKVKNFFNSSKLKKEKAEKIRQMLQDFEKMTEDANSALKKESGRIQFVISDFFDNYSKEYLSNAAKRVKNLNDKLGFVLSMATIPFTCTLLNWVYPRFMEKVFPDLSNAKKLKQQGVK